jgi:acetyltransferase-like isoleucine patch superfamily enzyme
MRRQIEGDWCEIGIPENATVHETALIETSMCFDLWRSEQPGALVMEEGAGIYTGTILDVGPRGKLRLGRCAIVTAAVVMCDLQITIGDYALISWNVVIMDSYRMPIGRGERAKAMTQLPTQSERRPRGLELTPRPVTIESNVWIGFDSVILPGVTIGEGSIVGCRSVVDCDVPAYTVVGGNPARVIKQIPRPEAAHA